MFKRGHADLKRTVGRCDSDHAGRDLVRWEERKADVRRRRERARSDVLRDLVARQLAFPVHQPAWHAGVGDRRLPERPPRLIASAVRAVEDVGAGRFGIDDRAPFDPPDLFREEWIVRDVRLRLLRQGIGGVELVRVGQPDDLRQRFLPRPAHLRVALRPPGDATGDDGERDGSSRELHAARRPRPRDRRQRS